jgi:deazaflavin-dependent oxidoreductase (nitroreductase family)
MPKSLSDVDPSKGLYRFGFRLPIYLYRMHLGWLLGNRFLMLTTIGRKSGKQHQSIIEVVYREKQTGEYTIASGWGVKSDWYRNLKKNPKVLVNVGRSTFRAIADQLSTVDAEKMLLKYAHDHPLAFRELAKLMSGSSGKNTEETCRLLALDIPIITLHPEPADISNL